MNGINRLREALGMIYSDTAILADPGTAHLVVDGQHLLSLNRIPGVSLNAQADGEVIEAQLRIAAGTTVIHPIHLCIGMLAPEGRQNINLRIRLEAESSAALLAHCLFPNALAATHNMCARIEVGEGAELRYAEGHYHGRGPGAEVRPQSVVHLAPGARLFSDFTLTAGPVGRLEIDNLIEAEERAVTEITASVFGHGHDVIHIRDELLLKGPHACGLVKTRVAVEDEASSEVIGITEGAAEGARGHMDCTEIVRDRAIARAEPIVRVTHPLAKVTHEAAVGTVDQAQLETLMAHGLSPEEAVDTVITGMLRQ